MAFRAAWSDGSEVPGWGVKSRVQAVQLDCKLLVSQGQLFAGTQPAAPQPWVSLQASASSVPSAPADRAHVTLTGPWPPGVTSLCSCLHQGSCSLSSCGWEALLGGDPCTGGLCSQKRASLP